jgi:hypothetical protein
LFDKVTTRRASRVESGHPGDAKHQQICIAQNALKTEIFEKLDAAR